MQPCAPVPKFAVICLRVIVLACLLLGEVGGGSRGGVYEEESGCPFYCSVSFEMEKAQVLVAAFCFLDEAETALVPDLAGGKSSCNNINGNAF